MGDKGGGQQKDRSLSLSFDMKNRMRQPLLELSGLLSLDKSL